MYIRQIILYKLKKYRKLHYKTINLMRVPEDLGKFVSSLTAVNFLFAYEIVEHFVFCLFVYFVLFFK